MGGVRNSDHQVYDVLVIGGGPAGLTATLNLVTEGRKVIVLDGECECGGQARHALRIVNVFGVSGGVRGQQLVANTRRQIEYYGGAILLESEVASLTRDAGRFVVTCRGGRAFIARAIVIATGTSWRRLSVFDSYLRNGSVVYGSPGYDQRFDRRSVLVVGGGNSAGQAALHVARRGAEAVHLVMRCRLGARMSSYLVGEIRSNPFIVVHEGMEVAEAQGRKRFQSVKLSSGDVFEVDAAYLLAGGTPNTTCVGSFVTCDSEGYVVTDRDGTTSVQGVFAVGDVRAGAVKRVQAATGDGAAVVPSVHRWLDSLVLA